MLNTIIWGGRAIRGGSDWTGIDQDRLNVDIESGSNHKFIVNYSNIQNSTGTSFDDDNIYDVPPVFKDADSDDFSLDDASPLIGAGIATWTSESITAPTKDILKVTRGTVPDIGAYEHSLDASTAPLPVTGVTGVPVTSGAKLTWSANDASLTSTTDATDIKRYEVFQDKSGTFTPVDSTTDVTSTIKGLTHGTSYTFKVRAVNSSDVAGGFSDTVKVTPEFKGPKWYVSTSGVSTNEGSSTAPLSHLSGAIDKAASGDTVVVLKGTHSGVNNRGIDFDASKPLVIMGDPSYAADSTIIDAGDNNRHFAFNSGEDTTYQIIGLTLKNGYQSRNGGSVYIYNSGPLFKNVIFKSNRSVYNNDSRIGGAVYIDGNSSPRFYDCKFRDNRAESTDDNQHAVYGGAVAIAQGNTNSSSLTRFVRCLFDGNTVSSKTSSRGGAVYSSAQVDFVNCVFSNNVAEGGVGNTGSYWGEGGALAVEPGYYDGGDWQAGTVKVINCTFNGNKAASKAGAAHTTGGAIYGCCNNSQQIVMFNTIIWGSVLENSTVGEEYISVNTGALKYISDYNNIEYLSHYLSWVGDSSLEINPQFTNAGGGDYTLSDASHLIGAGVAAYEGVSAPTTDLAGNSRPNPAGSNPDIGAYENALNASPYPALFTALTRKK